MNKIKKGIYIIHFENDNENIYKIGSTTNLTKRLKQFQTSHIGKINIVRFYDMTENTLKGEEILQWRLRKNRIKYNQEFFKIDNLDDVDIIANDIIPIINEGLYPSNKSTEEHLRLFVIKILGGVKEDIESQEEEILDTHRRFNYFITHTHDYSNAVKNNNEIINILIEWKLLFKSSKFSFEAWKGSPFYWFTLKFDYTLNNKYDEIIKDLDYLPRHWHYCSKNLYHVDDDEKYEYGFGDCCSYGTISIIVQIIKTITLSRYYKTKLCKC